MSDVAVEASWREGLRFEVVGRAGVPGVVDGDGRDGLTPMETALAGLAGCMGSDVLEILGKMRVPLEGLSVRVAGDRRGEFPRRYTAIRLTYRAEGLPEGELPKLERAIELSRSTYCSVLHSLRPDLEVSIEIEAG